jgi:6-phosphogluconolactonase
MPAIHCEILRCRDAAALASTAAAQWVTDLTHRGVGQGNYTVALSGGRITQAFFAQIVTQVKARSVALADVHFFWADERCVPPDNQDSNFKLADEHLFQPLNIASAQIHRLHGEDEPKAAARAAEAGLRATATGVCDGQPVLDMVFLGMGEDGHVASLFPGEAPSMMQDEAVYRAVLDSPKPPPERLTLGYRALAVAKEVWVLSSGGGKEAALRASLNPGGETPLGRVLSSRSQTRLWTDIRL